MQVLIRCSSTVTPVAKLQTAISCRALRTDPPLAAAMSLCSEANDSNAGMKTIELGFAGLATSG